jgi:large subunit ribosomal protein LP1
VRPHSPVGAHAPHQAEKINTLTSAANVEVEPIWATLLARALEGKNVKELLANVGSGGGGAPVAAGGAPAAAAGGAPAAAAEAEKPKEEEKEESDDDMVSLCWSAACGDGRMLTTAMRRASVCSTECFPFLASSCFVSLVVGSLHLHCTPYVSMQRMPKTQSLAYVI